MKKSLSYLFAGLGLFAFTSCGGGGNSEDAATEEVVVEEVAAEEVATEEVVTDSAVVEEAVTEETEEAAE